MGDRAWVWFVVDPDGKHRAIAFLADELSAQDLHGEPYQLVHFEPGERNVTLERPRHARRVLKLPQGFLVAEGLYRNAFCVRLTKWRIDGTIDCQFRSRGASYNISQTKTSPPWWWGAWR